jgi:hypothetical protein
MKWVFIKELSVLKFKLLKSINRFTLKLIDDRKKISINITKQLFIKWK